MSKANGPSACPIVGIGSSAGGLDALKAFFTGLPADTGAAFIVIQHLDPTHESLTAEILSRSTPMPVVQIRDGMEVEANHVYVIPPNAYLALRQHQLILSEPILMHGVRMPIDSFLLSLTDQYEERAIAIILSGTGSDGALGLREIKGNGGLVMAQAPETAQYDGMPQSAISTGLVDMVCPVEDMPDHLTRYLQHPYIGGSKLDEPGKSPDDQRSMASILAVLRTWTGHDFRAYKSGTLGRRIARRMSLHHISQMDEYVVFLRENDDETKLLFQDLLIGVTSFFRDPEAFEALDKEVITPLVESRQTDEPIRVWVPGCASGEEAYSIAMLLIERLEAAHKHCAIQLFASDIDEPGLAFGRTGIYPENIVANVSPERIKRFFTKQGHSFRVSKTLRETITFATQDLIGDPPFSNLDLISCRNLLIYLEPEVQRKLLTLFHFALTQRAWLFLGHSETTGQQQELFESVSKKWRIYRRASQTRKPSLDFPIGARKPCPPGAGMSTGKSVNEELETSKEELQSMNEELTTANNQLKDKVEELAEANDDLDNLLSSTDVATLFLDTNFRIGRFTPATKPLLNLISSDIGRPLSDIRPNFIDKHLMDDARRVLEKLQPLEAEIVSEDGACYLRRILPYRTGDNRIAGIVITFIDITEREKAAEQAERLASVVRGSNDAVTLQDMKGKLIAWNHGAEAMYGWNEREVIGKNMREILTGPEYDEMMSVMDRTTRGETVRRLETRRMTKDGKYLDVWLTLTPLKNQAGEVIAIATTERDVTENKRVMQKLRQAKIEAESAYAAKSRFLATASHDLRQPLQSLNLLNATLFQSADDPHMRKLIALQGESLDSMSRLLNSLLDISKLDSGTITPVTENVAVKDIFDHLTAEFEPEAHKKGLDLIIEPTTEVVLTDLGLLAQLLQNLLANAFKFTRQGSIHVSCTRMDDTARIEVEDTGIGIPEEHLHHIFDEFHQVNRDPQQRHGGLGLGLSIVHRIAKLLGTRVAVASEIGRGSTFLITLPISQSGSADEAEPKTADQPGASLSGRILLVEDDPAVLDASIMFLSMEKGLEIFSASSPPKAYELLKTCSPDVVITDYHLNHADSGIDIVRAARKNAGHMIPAILITGDTSSEVNGFKMEGIQVMCKPIKPSDLVQKILKLLQKA